MPKSPQLAKLTRPRLGRIVARERLFQLLDEARQTRPVLCVVGPPGAGKTTLVANWLDARNVKGVWYQVDAGDADLATFFYYLGLAARPFARRGRPSLPLLTPEHLGDVSAFSRRYFRELFSRLPEAAALVLDNYQEVAHEERLHALIAEAVDEIPPGVTLITVSRRDPPECYARLMANERVGTIDRDALKLSVGEAKAIAAGRAGLGDVDIAQVHGTSEGWAAGYIMSQGWAAGYILLLEELREGGLPSDAAPVDSLRGVFEYFAGQLFERTTPRRQQLLLCLSFLPRMSAHAAEQLTGTAEASALLEELHRRHPFTDRRQAGAAVYEFHALLHAFLQHQATQALSLPEQSRLTRQAACILEQSGQPEEAMPLHLRAGEADAAQALILREAPRLIGQGRWKVVMEWMGALPHQRVHADCWLMHWLGTAQIAVAPAEARTALERSAELAQEARDPLCRLQAAAGIVQTYMLEYVQFRPMDRWIDVLHVALDQKVAFPNDDSELRVFAALLIALAYRRPDSDRVVDCAQRVLELSQRPGEVNLRALSVAYVVAYGGTTGPLDVARRACPFLVQLLSHSEITARTAAWGWFMASFFYLLVGEERQCLAAVSRVERVGVEQGLRAAIRLAAVIATWHELGAGRTTAARGWLQRLGEVIVPGNPYDEASAASLEGHLHALEGEAERAGACLTRAMERYDDAGTHFHRCYARTHQAWVAIMRGDTLAARQWIVAGLQLAQQTRSGWLEVELRLAEAYLALQQEQHDAAAESLRQAFALGRRVDCIWAFQCCRAWMPPLCAAALESGIEVDYVRSIIRQTQLGPPAQDLEFWPWHVRIHTLGRFEVSLADQPLHFAHKTPRKPLALLQVLIALGGSDVPEHRIIDALWPAEEGDAAGKSCRIALHRLRELLGSQDAVTAEGGVLGLNRKLCWVDAWQLERQLAEATALLREGNRRAFMQIAERIARLYRGAFLACEAGAHWAFSLRERLRGRFIQVVEAAGHELESEGRYEAARDWYLRGLEADDLTESFYQGLMRCYEATGRRAEALSVFRRMRHTLSVTLGVVPSAQSEALYRSVRAA